MLWLILCVFASTSIFVIFKLIDKFKTPLFNTIIINYIVASVFGFFISKQVSVSTIVNSDWFLQSAIIGVLFITMFFLVGLSSQKVGISITTVAGKMSVVIPMVFAIWAFSEPFGSVKLMGIVLALLAVSMSVYKKKSKTSEVNLKLMLIPIVLFVGMGIVDSTVIYSKEKYVDDALASVFSASIFLFALITGVILSIFNLKVLKNFKQIKTWFYGIMLGLVNYGSIYFMIRALNSGVFQNSVVYGIINIGIVSLSVIIGTLIFKEKLTPINRIGIFLSIIAIGILSIADL